MDNKQCKYIQSIYCPKVKNMAGPGRPPIAEEVKRTIVQIHDRHPAFSVRDIKKRWFNLAPDSLRDKSPGHSKINEIVKEADGNKEKMGIEKAWTSATLNNEPVSPDAIHWLIRLQIWRKSFYSKPLTIREAKWFNRLSGFREEFSSSFLLNIGIPAAQHDLFISHLIATRAELYAYREKIDTIAGIKEPDYSDLDINIATDNLSAVNDYNYKSIWDSLPIATEKLPNANSASFESGFQILLGLKGLMTKLDEDRLVKWGDKNLLPLMIYEIRYVEICLLYHSLGDPGMGDNSIHLYFEELHMAVMNAAFCQRLMKLPYILRFSFLVFLRKWAKEHPDAAVTMIKPKVKMILDQFEKEVEVNDKALSANELKKTAV